MSPSCDCAPSGGSGNGAVKEIDVHSFVDAGFSV